VAGATSPAGLVLDQEVVMMLPFGPTQTLNLHIIFCSRISHNCSVLFNCIWLLFSPSELLPDKMRQKTAVVKHDASPSWNHTFVFLDLSPQELTQRSLQITVWDYGGLLKSNEFLGGVRLNTGTGKLHRMVYLRLHYYLCMFPGCYNVFNSSSIWW